MTSICSECGFEFKESTTQAYARMKNDTKKICRDCNRINNAEERAEQRKLAENLTQSPLFKTLEKIENERGIIPVTLLQRKFKWTFKQADEVLKLYHEQKLSV